MNCSDNINELLARHFAGEPLDGAQQAELDAYILANGKEYGRLKSIMEEPEPNGHGQKWDVAAAWKKVERRIENVVQDERETEHRASSGRSTLFWPWPHRCCCFSGSASSTSPAIRGLMK